MSGEPELAPAVRAAVADSVLRNNPGALVAALNLNGLLVPMPPSVQLYGQPVLTGVPSTLDLVTPDDHIVVVEAWGRARLEGAAVAVVHQYTEPEHEVTVHFVDATERYGVFLGIIIGLRGNAVATPDQPNIRPRLSIVHKNEMSIISEVDSAISLILGWSADELLGHRSLEFLHPDDHERAITNWMEMLARPGAARRVRLRHRHRDGSWVWFEVTNHNRLNDADHRHVLAEMLDISDEMSAQEALRANEQLLRRLTEVLPLGIVQIDAEGRVVYRNERLSDIVGVARAETVTEQLSAVVEADRAAVRGALDAVLHEGRDSDLEVALGLLGSQIRHCGLRIRGLTGVSGEVSGAILCISDITEDVRMRAELRDRADYDALTRCHSRVSILGTLSRLLDDGASGRGTAAIFVDLDRFKEINDLLGHAAGDDLLKAVAQRLVRAARDSDPVGRLGGDEFLVVCTNVESPAEALHVGERLAAPLHDPMELCGTRVVPLASVGVAWSPPGAGDADGLIARADAAMYESKRIGGGKPVLAEA